MGGEAAMEIGARITELREARSLTTNRLANLCGLSQSFLRCVELGEKGISVENLKLICDKLEISLRDFFDVPEEDASDEAVLLSQVRQLTAEQQVTLSSFLKTIRR